MTRTQESIPGPLFDERRQKVRQAFGAIARRSSNFARYQSYSDLHASSEDREGLWRLGQIRVSPRADNSGRPAGLVSLSEEMVGTL